MSRFRFRLARILRVREVEEQAARERFLEAQRLAREAEQRAQAARDELARGQAQLCGEPETALQPGFVLLAHTTLESLRRRRQALSERARTSGMQAEAQRESWAARRRDVRGLERLESRDRERWLAEESRLEAAVSDEVAGIRDAARRADQRSGETLSEPMHRTPTP